MVTTEGSATAVARKDVGGRMLGGEGEVEAKEDAYVYLAQDAEILQRPLG